MTKAARFSLFILLFLSCFLLEANNVIQFGAIKIRVSLEPSPVTLRSSAGSGVYSAGGLNLVNNRWLAVQVSFVPGAVSRSALSGTRRTGHVGSAMAVPGRWIDDVTMRVKVVFPVANYRKNNVVYGLFSGNTDFWSVKLDGRRHTAQMFLPPQLIERYAASAASGRRELQMGVSDFRVLVEFVDNRGAVLGSAFTNMGNNNIAGVRSFFKNLQDGPGNVVVKDCLVPRNRSPWAWHMPATFDYIKSSSKGSSGSDMQ